MFTEIGQLIDKKYLLLPPHCMSSSVIHCGQLAYLVREDKKEVNFYGNRIWKSSNARLMLTDCSKWVKN